MHTLHNMAGRTVCAVPPGIEIKEDGSLAELKAAIGNHTKVAAEGFKQFREHAEKTAGDLSGIDARLTNMEQKISRRGGGNGGDDYPKTTGAEFVGSAEYKSFHDNGFRGVVRFRKSITSAANSGAALTSPDYRPDVIARPRPKLTMRNIITVAQTTSPSIRHPRQLTRTNNATFVAEGALKPESNMTFETVEAPVRTLATWITASNQILADAPQLQAFLDIDLRYMIGEVEELAILFGNGTGENLLGLWPQATAYDTALNAAGDTPVDTILKAIGQAERTSGLPVTGIVVNSADWAAMVGLKDSTGQYLGGGPFGTTTPQLWGIPVVATLSMTAGQFLVGNFQTAVTLYDSMTTEVLISSEHADYWTRNLCAIRAEERIALVAKMPSALVKASYPA